METYLHVVSSPLFYIGAVLAALAAESAVSDKPLTAVLTVAAVLCVVFI